jgi:hypothetical protein
VFGGVEVEEIKISLKRVSWDVASFTWVDGPEEGSRFKWVPSENIDGS